MVPREDKDWEVLWLLHTDNHMLHSCRTDTISRTNYKDSIRWSPQLTVSNVVCTVLIQRVEVALGTLAGG